LLAGSRVDEATVAVIGLHCGGVAVAQLQRGRALPRLPEPADVGELVAGGAHGEVGERAARADRGQLAGVADEQQLRPGPHAPLMDGGELGGGGHPGLVDHDQVAVGERSRRVAAADRGQPPRGVHRGQALG
jgi:hypothetical protein